MLYNITVEVKNMTYSVLYFGAADFNIIGTQEYNLLPCPGLLVEGYIIVHVGDLVVYLTTGQYHYNRDHCISCDCMVIVSICMLLSTHEDYSFNSTLYNGNNCSSMRD